MNRYVIYYSNGGEQSKHALIQAKMEGVLAETPEKAKSQFLKTHQGSVIHDCIVVNELDKVMFGYQALTKEEKDENPKTELQKAFDLLFEISSEEMTLILDYTHKRESELTQNVEEVHVGDILGNQEGRQQVETRYYQVTELKGIHTIIVRRIKAKTVHIKGTNELLCRPLRNSFHDDVSYTLRTSFKEGELHISDPEKSNGILYPVDPCGFVTWYRLSILAANRRCMLSEAPTDSV